MSPELVTRIYLDRKPDLDPARLHRFSHDTHDVRRTVRDGGRREPHGHRLLNFRHVCSALADSQRGLEALHSIGGVDRVQLAVRDPTVITPATDLQLSVEFTHCFFLCSHLMPFV